jgi:hypothetical protein
MPFWGKNEFFLSDGARSAPSLFRGFCLGNTPPAQIIAAQISKCKMLIQQALADWCGAAEPICQRFANARKRA